MAIPDISGLTKEELSQLVQQASALQRDKEAVAHTVEGTLQTELTTALLKLEGVVASARARKALTNAGVEPNMPRHIKDLSQEVAIVARAQIALARIASGTLDTATLPSDT